jgi:hypothetical protein
MPADLDFSFDPVLLTVILVIALGLLVLYFVLLVRALVEMLRLEAPPVIIVFTYISLIPFPLLLILGILNLIIWHYVRKGLMVARGSGG